MHSQMQVIINLAQTREGYWGEKLRTCSWKAVRFFEEVMTEVEVHEVTVVAGKSISAR